MKLPNSPEYQVTVTSSPTASWYEREVEKSIETKKPFVVTVCESNDFEEWCIAEGEFKDRHIEKKYCKDITMRLESAS